MNHLISTSVFKIELYCPIRCSAETRQRHDSVVRAGFREGMGTLFGTICSAPVICPAIVIMNY